MRPGTLPGWTEIAEDARPCYSPVMANWTLLTLVLAVCSSTVHPQEPRNRRENKVLLGVVTEPVKGGLEVLLVLPKSPAEGAGIKVGDILTRVSEVKLDNPMQLDDALQALDPGTKVSFDYKRKKKRYSGTATVVERSKYKGDFLKQRTRSSTGFEAPEWHAYSWGNLGRKQKPPTRQNTKGKIVVIHAFQGW